MTIEEAYRILDLSIKSLEKRKAAAQHRVYISDVEADVIHVACLTILQNNAIKEAADYARAFTEAGKKVTYLYTDKEAANNTRDILKNVQWNALWEQLQEYFKKVHNRDIGERELF
jgi:hypothetical protein